MSRVRAPLVLALFVALGLGLPHLLAALLAVMLWLDGLSRIWWALGLAVAAVIVLRRFEAGR